MRKEVSPKLVALSFGIIVLSFLAAFYVIAWQEPAQAPPEGNVAAPLNVGPQGQAKEGGLILNTGGAATGLIVDEGNVGIGTTAPKQMLDVRGGLNLQDANNAALIYFPRTGTYPNLYIRSDDDPSTWEAESERLFVGSNGNVGIGKTNPGAKLDIEAESAGGKELRICKSGVCCPIWKDCDGDGRTYGNGDCDESCPTCYVGSGAYTHAPDGKDQNCNEVVDDVIGDTYEVHLNQITMKSCNTICVEQGCNSCVSIGINGDATNREYWESTFSFEFEWSEWVCDNQPGDCGTVMDISPGEAGNCVGHPTWWTNCRCACPAYH